MNNQNSAQAATGTSVTLACTQEASASMEIVESNSASYVLTTEPVSIDPIEVGNSFNINFYDIPAIPTLPLQLNDTASTKISGTSSWTSTAANTYKYIVSGSTRATVNVSFGDDAAEIIIVGTVPTLPEDDK